MWPQVSRFRSFGLEANFTPVTGAPSPLLGDHSHEGTLRPAAGPARSSATQRAAAPAPSAPAPSTAPARRMPRSIDEVDNGAILGFAAELSEASGWASLTWRSRCPGRSPGWLSAVPLGVTHPPALRPLPSPAGPPRLQGRSLQAAARGHLQPGAGPPHVSAAACKHWASHVCFYCLPRYGPGAPAASSCRAAASCAGAVAGLSTTCLVRIWLPWWLHAVACCIPPSLLTAHPVYRGEPIPRIHYLPEEEATWGLVLGQLEALFPQHACKEVSGLHWRAVRVAGGSSQREGSARCAQWPTAAPKLEPTPHRVCALVAAPPGPVTGAGPRLPPSAVPAFPAAAGFPPG